MARRRTGISKARCFAPKKTTRRQSYASLDEPGQRHPGGQAPRACGLAEESPMRLKSTTQRLRSRALFTIAGGVVVINPAFAQEQATSPVASQTRSETLEEVVVTGLRASLQASMDIKRHCGRRGRRDYRGGHGQVPGHESGRVAAANHRHLHRPPQRRGRAGQRSRLWAAVQPGDPQRPSGTGRRRVRQRRDHDWRPGLRHSLLQFRPVGL